VETVRTGTEWFAVDDASVVGAARRPAVRLAERLGFDDSRVGDVGIVVSEIAANLWKHAVGAALGIQVALRDGVAGVRVIATDNGPGMADLDLSALDGHSTAGTLGVGLGAVHRLSSVVDISSVPGRGTVLVADLWPDDGVAEAAVEVAGVTRPIAGETRCGDAVAARTLGSTHLLMLSDGLGHGQMAADASLEAVGAFHAATSPDVPRVLEAIQAELMGTRGAAVAVAAIDESYRTLQFAGIGNVSAFVVDGRRAAALSQPGIVGHQRPRIRPFSLQLSDAAIVVLHSDGVRENWDLSRTPGLARRSAAVIAATVLRDCGNRPDDASVLVARRPR
jgi:anti-sigma regulatory factor (Ser/Thr protein kinase)